MTLGALLSPATPEPAVLADKPCSVCEAVRKVSVGKC